MSSRLRHPHVVSFLDFDEDPERNALFLYMEYCTLGDLQHRHAGPPPPMPPLHSELMDLDDDGESDEQWYRFYPERTHGIFESSPMEAWNVWSLIYQISSALAYLHHGFNIRYDQGMCRVVLERTWSCIMHRDIKPANSEFCYYRVSTRTDGRSVVMRLSQDGHFVFKLCDLGIASELGSTTQYIGTRDFWPPVRDITPLTAPILY
jgi:serine/threonine protein kinase